MDVFLSLSTLFLWDGVSHRTESPLFQLGYLAREFPAFTPQCEATSIYFEISNFKVVPVSKKTIANAFWITCLNNAYWMNKDNSEYFLWFPMIYNEFLSYLCQLFWALTWACVHECVFDMERGCDWSFSWSVYLLWSACSSGSEAGKKEPKNPIFQGQLHCIWKPLLVAKAKPTFFTKLCLGHDLVCFSIAVNTMTKSNLEGKGFSGFHIPGHSPSLREVRAGT